MNCDIQKADYKILYFHPRTDITLGCWGFQIELDYEFARKLVIRTLKPEYYRRLNEMADSIQRAVFRDADRDADRDRDYQRRRTYQFWDDTCLLTNMTVEPGNACGLDMEHSAFDMVKKGTADPYERVVYQPHNVDNVRQAAALLAVFLNWYDHILYCG